METNTYKSKTIFSVIIFIGIVAASYLQAKDEANYNKWKAIETEKGRKAKMFIE